MRSAEQTSQLIVIGSFINVQAPHVHELEAIWGSSWADSFSVPQTTQANAALIDSLTKVQAEQGRCAIAGIESVVGFDDCPEAAPVISHLSRAPVLTSACSSIPVERLLILFLATPDNVLEGVTSLFVVLD